MLRTSHSREEDFALRINSYFKTLLSLVLFVTTWVAFVEFGSPNAPAPSVQPPAQVTNAVISVTPDCVPLATVDLTHSGVSTSAATGTCVLTIDRERHPFVVGRAESAATYDRTSPENTRDKLVIRVRESQLGVWVNELPSPAYSTWQCGFDVAPGSVSDDTCDGPLWVD